MMQTTNLLSQLTGAAAAPAPARPNAAANQDAGLSFSQTFSQAAQRQAAPSMPAPTPAAPAPAAKPANQQGPKQSGAPADKSPAARPGEAAKPAQASTGKTDKSAQADNAKAADAERDAEAAAEAAASAPVVDMLALVASLNQAAQAAVPADGAAPAEQEAGGADPALAALGAQLVPGEQPALEQDAEPLLAQPRQDARGQLQADDAAGALKPQLVAEELPADAAQPRFKLPEIQPQVAAQATPAAAPVQQTAMAQAVAGAAGDKLSARVGTQDWDNQVGQKIVWMVAGKEQSASLTLNPPDLGPMQVVLNVTNDHADVTFSAAQPEVRQALEDAMPRLREMMSESGLSLGNASVNAGMPEQRQANMGNGEGRQGRGGDGAANGDGSGLNGADQGSAAALEERAQARSLRTGAIRSLVDTYI